MEPATQIALELLWDYYGEDYIDSPNQLIELLKIEFDLNISVTEATFIINNKLELIDTFVNLNSCLWGRIVGVVMWEYGY